MKATKRQPMIQLVPAHCVRERISFLYQAELSIDRCINVQELRTYYARIWPGCSIDALLATWPKRNESRLVHQICVKMPSVLAFVEWFIYKRIFLTTAQIEESESCIRDVLSILRSSGNAAKEDLIPLRMRLYDAATSLCHGLSLKYVQSFRNVEHLNSAPHLSLRPFNANSCGLSMTCCRTAGHAKFSPTSYM